MQNTEKQVDENKGDEVLRRMLNMPPEPKNLPKPKPGKDGGKPRAGAKD